MIENEPGRASLADRIKKLWPGGKLKKDNFLVMILLGILLLIIVWPTDSGRDSKKNPTTESKSGLLDSNSGILDLTGKEAGQAAEYSRTDTEPEAYAEYLERKLEAILSVMEGAGRARVMITVSGSAETVVEKDAPTRRQGTTEVDGSGGSRNTSDIETGQDTIFVSDTAGKQIPYIRKTLHPAIEGVVVAIQGGGNEKIIRHITEAIMALFGIDEHKIKIVKMIS